MDAQPNKGMDVRSSTGAIVRSPEGDKARTARAMESARENMHVILVFVVAVVACLHKSRLI